jgi:solute carrier family 25 (peroxisomal adenine nucleotide transporter), member 17
MLGIIAGCVNVLLTTPFWVTNTRLKMSGINCSLPYSDLWGGIKYIAENEGLQALWAGTHASLLLSINPAIQFSVYEGIKRYLTKLYGQEKPSVVYFFFLGALSKLISTFITYPLQLVQTKLRHGNKENHQKIGTLEMLVQILKSKGIKGLYCGLEAKIWQTILTAALMFSAYEKIVRFVKFLLRATAPVTS